MDRCDEIWKDVTGYEGLYQVSNFGRVKSFGNTAGRKTKILKHNVGSLGYAYVVLCKDKVQKTFKIHRLMAVEFIPNPTGRLFVNFKNADRSDLRLENLEWCNMREVSSRRWNGHKREGKYAGVYRLKKNVRWTAMITVSSKSLHLGVYDTEEEAYNARLKFMEKYKIENKFL